MNDLIQIGVRSGVTIALFGLFLALIAWAWSPRRKREFSDAANSVFDEAPKSDTENTP